MPTKRLSFLLKNLETQPLFFSDLDPEISGIQFDSREVSQGDLFVAIVGGHVDGHAFIAQAVERGAAAIVVERETEVPVKEIPFHKVASSRAALADLAAAFYDHPTRELFTVGVTGTKGKSSTCHLCAAVLGEDKTELITTITNALNRDVEQTTPESTTLQRLASEALRAGRSNLIVETSAHALEQQRARAVDFDVAIFTNLSHDHFDYFANWEVYLGAKSKLFAQLKSEGTAIFNINDEAFESIANCTNAKIISYGMNSEAEISGAIESMSLDGSRVSVKTPSGNFEFFLHLPGEFYAENALAAIALGHQQRMQLEEIKERLESVAHIEGRFERFSSNSGYDVVVDFAHSPDSLEKMLQLLNSFYPRVITLFGCGGDSDRAKRPLMGEISGRLSSFTVLTNDNPKHEDPLKILKEIEAGIGRTAAQYEVIPDRKAAIDRATELAEPGDVILIAGKGHERKQYFDGYETEFNDRAYLSERGVINEKNPDGSTAVKT